MRTPPVELLDFGTMSGFGIFEDGHFDIHGVPGSKGYVLDVTGDVSHGRVEGEFRLFGNAGSCHGPFVGY